MKKQKKQKQKQKCSDKIILSLNTAFIEENIRRQKPMIIFFQKRLNDLATKVFVAKTFGNERFFR